MYTQCMHAHFSFVSLIDFIELIVCLYHIVIVEKTARRIKKPTMMSGLGDVRVPMAENSNKWTWIFHISIPPSGHKCLVFVQRWWQQRCRRRQPMASMAATHSMRSIIWPSMEYLINMKKLCAKRKKTKSSLPLIILHNAQWTMAYALSMYLSITKPTVSIV